MTLERRIWRPLGRLWGLLGLVKLWPKGDDIGILYFIGVRVMALVIG